MSYWEPFIEDHKKWEERNFPDSSGPIYSVMGVVEEMGELAHAHLKGLQGIRGDAHIDEAKDAIGDMTIYLLGVMAVTGPPKEQGVTTTNADRALMGLSHAVGQLAACYVPDVEHKTNKPTEYTVGRIIWYLGEYGDHMGWQCNLIFEKTWESVKRRDWITYPKDGLTE